MDETAVVEERAAYGRGQEYIAVHYGCENFHEAKGRPAAVSCIAVASLGEGSSRAFSLADAPPEMEGDEREIDLLRRFFEFLRGKQDARLLHWNMNTSAYGFEALALRFRFLVNDPPPYTPPPSRMLDVDALVASQFGSDYVKHPKLPNLVAINGMHRRSFLSGQEEAERFTQGDIGAIRSSLTEKCRFIGRIFEMLLAGELNTQSSAGSVEFAGSRLDAVAVAVDLGQRFLYCQRSLANQRHGARDTIVINDEYDAQDLYRSLLKIFFDDVRDEAWTPDYAGGASRVDFVLPEFGIAIELKYSRGSLDDKKIGDQLIIDRDRYAADTRIRHLVCLVFDHEGILSNPRGLESDLRRDVSIEGLTVSVRIYDR